MGRMMQKVKKFLKCFDFFNTKNLLRFQDEPQYKSVSGALVSITLIIIFMVIFTNTVLNTLNMTDITASFSQSEDVEPTFFETSVSPFLFAVGINGINLNDPVTKYFNIIFYARTQYPNGTKITTYTNLQPCTRDPWNNIEQSFGKTFDRIGLSNWLCLPPNMTLQFQGKYSSSIFKYAKIAVQNCSILAGDNRTCANSTYINNFLTASGSASFNYYFVNTIINAEDKNYISYYIEDRNYFQFTKTLGMTANMFISSYQIDTDESLWPIQKPKTDVGGIVFESAQTFVIQPTTEYIQLYLRKSSLSMTVQRSFKKVDETLSYIGGLFSTMIICLFFMEKFSEFGFEIKIASFLYKFDSKQKVKDGSYNLLTFFPYCFYLLLNSLGRAPDWKVMNHLHETRHQVSKQIDFTFLIKRVQFIEDSLTYLFDDFQLRCLHMKKRLTLSEAAEKRRLYRSGRKIRNIAKAKFEQQKELARQKENEGNIDDMIEVAARKKRRRTLRERRQETKRLKDETESSADSGNDSSDMNDEEERRLIEDSMESIYILEQKAKQGNERCMKIFNRMHSDLHKVIEKGAHRTSLNQGSPYFMFRKKTNQQLLMIEDYSSSQMDSVSNFRK